ncbi:MAG: glucose 1-dehydrogenase [Actinomycetota bacterium]
MSDPEVLRLLDEPPSLCLTGRSAWVTGASRGLGEAIAFGLAGQGAEVILTARDAVALARVEAAIHERGGRALAVPGSVTDPAARASAVARIEAEWGGLDVLVNNAGISPHFARAESLDPEVLGEVLEVNASGALGSATAALPMLEARGGGSVVNVSSVHGSRAAERLVAYAASKGALEMITRTLALEWADRGIRVNSLAPGYIETAMTEGLRKSPRWSKQLLERTPLGRFASTAEIVACVLFLSGPASSYVTGTTLFADGGWSAR